MKYTHAGAKGPGEVSSSGGSYPDLTGSSDGVNPQTQPTSGQMTGNETADKAMRQTAEWANPALPTGTAGKDMPSTRYRNVGVQAREK